jgi:hypothetical protein
VRKKLYGGRERRSRRKIGGKKKFTSKKKAAGNMDVQRYLRRLIWDMQMKV